MLPRSAGSWGLRAGKLLKPKIAVIALVTAVAGGVATAAAADPCLAVPEGGPTPAYLKRGAEFSGPVSYVGDGDSLCVATGPTQAEWVEVRLADFYAPEIHADGGSIARERLSRLIYGRHLTCRADHRSYDRIVAVCRLGRVSVGDLMRQMGGTEGGRGWRQR